MSVQVVYKNKGKSSNSGIIALFANEVFQVKNLLGLMSGNESSFVQKILNNKKNNKENIIAFNISEKTTVIVIAVKKDLNGHGIENLGASFFNFVKKNAFKEISIISDSLNSKAGVDFIGSFIHGLKLKSYEFNIYKSKKIENKLLINLIG